MLCNIPLHGYTTIYVFIILVVDIWVVSSLGLLEIRLLCCELEKEMATHASILAWRIPWAEEPGGLQSMGSQRVGHNLVIKQQQCYEHFWMYTFLLASSNTREDSTHGHHQMVNTEIRLIICFAAKDGEALYSQQKKDWELTVAQILNSLLSNSDLN